MHKKGYRNIFLGFVIALINFRFGLINISYIIGYFLIGYGFSVIQEGLESKDFKVVNHLANILMLGSIFVPILITLISHIDAEYSYEDIYITVLTMCYYTIKFAMIFFIFTGIISICIQKQLIIESNKLEKIQKFYIISNIVYLIFLSVSINISNKIFSHFITILLMIIELYFIIILYKILKRMEIEEKF